MFTQKKKKVVKKELLQFAKKKKKKSCKILPHYDTQIYTVILSGSDLTDTVWYTVAV